MGKEKSTLEIEVDGETVILTPKRKLGELEFQDSKESIEAVNQLVDETDARYVLIDFHKIDYVSSSALGSFIQTWKKLERKGGQLVLCSVPEHITKLLKLTTLDKKWPSYPSREEALAAVGK